MYRNDRGLMPFPYVSSVQLTYNKVASSRLLSDSGFCVIPNVSYDGETIAQLYAKLGVDSTGSLVIKPIDSSASRGLTLHVRTESDLDTAIAKARRHSQKVIVEPYVRGEELRFAVIDGRVSMVIHKMKPRVTGDGSKTLRQLIDSLNRQRREWNYPYVRYQDIVVSEIDAGLQAGLDNVVAHTETVILCDSVAIEHGASFHDVTTRVHESYSKLAVGMAELFGRGYIAIDLLIDDYTRPADSDGYVFLEINDLPGMQLFCQASTTKEVAAGRDLALYIDKVLHV